MIVMKFGGTSVGNADRIKNVAEIVTSKKDQNPLVVVSAVGGVTDLLLNAVKHAVKGEILFDDIYNLHYSIINDLELDESSFEMDLDDMKRILVGISYLGEISPRVNDMFVSFGERISAKILARYLTKSGTEAVSCPAFDFGMMTDSNFGSAAVLDETYDEIPTRIKSIGDRIPVVTGFIGKDKNGDVTTLGRGGSDYTAAIYGAALKAEEIQIWTDVTGVMTADPSLIKDAASIEHLSFREAGELAYYGARVLHPSTILPAMKKGIKVRVLNTFEPQSAGTVITEHAVATDRNNVTKSIAYKENQVLINIESTRMFMAYGFLSKIAEVFNKHEVVIDMISTSETTVSLTAAPGQNIDPVIKDLEEFAIVTADYGKSILCVVGEGIPDAGNVAGRMIGSLERENINLEMISQAKIGINISVLLNDEDIERAVNVLHSEFFG